MPENKDNKDLKKQQIHLDNEMLSPFSFASNDLVELENSDVQTSGETKLPLCSSLLNTNVSIRSDFANSYYEYSDGKLNFGYFADAIKIILDNNIAGFNYNSSKEEKQQLLATYKEDILSTRNIITPPVRIQMDQKLFPVISQSYTSLANNDESKAFSFINNFIKNYPEDRDSIYLKKALYDENGKILHTFSHSEQSTKIGLSLNRTRSQTLKILEANDNKNSFSKIFFLNSSELDWNYFENKNIFSKIMNSESKKNEVFSFLIQDDKTKHMTTVHLKKDDNKICVLGSDSAYSRDAYEDSFKKIAGILESKFSKDGIQIESSFERQHPQKNRFYCHIYSMLTAINIQTMPEYAFENKFAKAIEGDRLENKILEEIIKNFNKYKLSFSSDKKDADEYKNKLCENLIYLSAIQIRRENPKNTEVTAQKVFQLMEFSAHNLGTASMHINNKNLKKEIEEIKEFIAQEYLPGFFDSTTSYLDSKKGFKDNISKLLTGDYSNVKLENIDKEKTHHNGLNMRNRRPSFKLENKKELSPRL